MNIGIEGSLASATVKNSVSLIQFNFDFSLEKFEASKEYQPIRNELSALRLFNAENGPMHRTARKLGLLFEQLVPNTPNLLRVYGKRVTEILQQRITNPKGSPADGFFQNYVGVDGTSLWAAATSGVAAQGVYLLACMLARPWDARKATAIWAELIEKRQEDIVNQLSQGNVVSDSSKLASRQVFHRSELIEWDASARAWLARADDACVKMRDRYLLIVKNLNLSAGHNKDTYPNVMAAWTSAMVCLENHLCGISQEVYDGATLYAISAWHLFPDLVHFGKTAKPVKFNDRLFTKPAIMSLGLLEIKTTSDNFSASWSLALSNLRFYGDPVEVNSEEDRNRVTLLQLQIIALGSVLESWRVPAYDRSDAIRFIAGFWRYLETTAPFDICTMSTSPFTSWLVGLGKAAIHVTSASGQKLEMCEYYLNYAEKRAENFLAESEGKSYPRLEPYFGLCNSLTMAALTEVLDIDAGIEYLRGLAVHMGLKEGQAIICYSERRCGSGYYEYATAIPHSSSIGYENSAQHARWIKFRDNITDYGDRCRHTCHGGSEQSDLRTVDLQHRMRMVRDRGEEVCCLVGRSLYERTVFNSIVSDERARYKKKSTKKSNILLWDNPPPVFRKHWSTIECAPQTHGSSGCVCLIPDDKEESGHDLDSSAHHQAQFKLYKSCGRFPDFLELFILSDISQPSQLSLFDVVVSQATKMSVKPSEGLQWLQSSKPNCTRIWDYIQSFANLEDHPSLIMREQLEVPNGLDWGISHGRFTDLIFDENIRRPPIYWFRSLELIGVVSEVYRNLKSATISLGITEYPLLDAHWAKRLGVPDRIRPREADYVRGIGNLLKGMDRERTLACIGMMQTATSNILPEHMKDVMAISSENSIFVPESLLNDPHRVMKPWHFRHIIGSVGSSGLNLMISPPGYLKISQPACKAALQRQFIYDSKREDKFHGTSLHLVLTGQKFPAVITDPDAIDQDIFYLQAVVQLRDEGNFVADLDILAIQKESICRVRLDCKCLEATGPHEDMDLRALNSWDEILVPPRRVAVVKAHENWAARLAAVVLLWQKNKDHTLAVIGEEKLCWKCLKEFFCSDLQFPEILID